MNHSISNNQSKYLDVTAEPVEIGQDEIEEILELESSFTSVRDSDE